MQPQVTVGGLLKRVRRETSGAFPRAFPWAVGAFPWAVGAVRSSHLVPQP